MPMVVLLFTILAWILQGNTPASTFKVVNSLIGLQTGVITDEKWLLNGMVWPGVGRTGTRIWIWKRHLKWVLFLLPGEVARRIGKDTMKLWVDSLGYGNMDISGPIDSFWLKIIILKYLLMNNWGWWKNYILRPIALREKCTTNSLEMLCYRKTIQPTG